MAAAAAAASPRARTLSNLVYFLDLVETEKLKIREYIAGGKKNKDPRLFMRPNEGENKLI